LEAEAAQIVGHGGGDEVARRVVVKIDLDTDQWRARHRAIGQNGASYLSNLRKFSPDLNVSEPIIVMLIRLREIAAF